MTVEDLIQRFRELQNGHRVDSGFNRGVTACIRVLMEEWEGQDVPDIDVGNIGGDAYQRGFEAGRKSEWTAVAEMKGGEE